MIDLLSFPTQHKLVAVGILAHGEVGRFAIFRLRLPVTSATGGDDLGCSGDDIRHLKG